MLDPSDPRSLTDDEYALIGKVVLAWGSAEGATGVAAAVALGITSHVVMREVVLRQPFERKIRMLEVAFQEHRFHPNLQVRVPELVWVFNAFKAARDVLVHGHENFDVDAWSSSKPSERGIALRARGRFLRAADLQHQLLGAEYAAEVAAGLSLGLLMNDTFRDALPQCPPRPQQPGSLALKD